MMSRFSSSKSSFCRPRKHIVLVVACGGPVSSRRRRRATYPATVPNTIMSVSAAGAMDIAPAAYDANAVSSCFRECCTSDSVPLAAPKSAFATGLTKIHDGPASAVFLGRFNGAPVAVKRPKLPTKAEIDRYHVELRLMLELTHDHILPLLAAHARPPEYFLVFPYQENGSVASLVHEMGWRPSWPAVLVLLRQVASALAFVHARGYVHRDVKPSNVLLDARWKATLCDFGLAESEEALRNSLQNAVYSEEDAEGRTVAGRLIATLGGGGKELGGPSPIRSKPQSIGGKPSGGFQKQHMVGTLPYMPPEVLMRRVPGFSADAYAFGVSACEVATGIAPYSDRERNVALAHTIMDLSYNESDLAVAIASENLRPSLPSETSREDETRSAGTADACSASPSARVAADGVSKLAAACWALDASARPSLEQVLVELERVVDAYKKIAGLPEAAPLEPRWSPPATAARDADETARQADAGLFADRTWPTPREGRGVAPPRWPKLPTTDEGDSLDSLFRAGVFSACGARGPDKMEDRHVLASDVGGVRGAHLACVFDGHRGFECAEFCRRNFEKALVSLWHECATPEEALTRTFAALDEAFVDAFERTKRVTETDDVSDDGDDVRTTSLRNGAKRLERFPGCTAIAALRWGARVYVANAGDCRAVVCREPTPVTRGGSGADGSRWVALSADHVADTNEAERARVVETAGPDALRVVNGVRRVGPAGLAVTRCVGDGDCKPYGVIATPEVTAYAVDASDEDTHTSGKDFALVLACDGLWDVVSNADARDLVLDTVKEPSMSAKRLGSEALARGSGDNVTVVVAFLKRTSTAETVTWERAF